MKIKVLLLFIIILSLLGCKRSNDEIGNNSQTVINADSNYKIDETEGYQVTENNDKQYNLELLEKINYSYENNDYLNVLILSDNASPNDKETYKQIYSLRNECLSSNKDYFSSQLDEAFANKDFDVIKKLVSYFPLDEDKEIEFRAINKIQGEYALFGNQNKEICVTISGYTVYKDNEKHTLDITRVQNDIGYIETKIITDNGEVIKNSEIGVIVITPKDGESEKYISSEGVNAALGREQEKNRQHEEYIKEKTRRESEYLSKEPRVGMTKKELSNSNWGTPNKINKTTYEWGVTEQWVYSNNRYVYLKNDIVTSISDSIKP